MDIKIISHEKHQSQSYFRKFVSNALWVCVFIMWWRDLQAGLNSAWTERSESYLHFYIIIQTFIETDINCNFKIYLKLWKWQAKKKKEIHLVVSSWSSGQKCCTTELQRPHFELTCHSLFSKFIKSYCHHYPLHITYTY